MESGVPNDSANDFMSFLDKTFQENMLYQSSPAIELEDDVQMGTPYWHQVIREHSISKPTFPQGSTLEGKTIGRGVSSMSSSRNKKRFDDSNQRSGILKGKTQKIVPRASRLMKSEDMTQLCKQGWTMGKGWDNRPKVAQINPVAVSDDIFKCKVRCETARANRLSRTSTSNRLVPTVWPEYNAIGATVSHNRIQSPGPKYNLQPQLGSDGQGIPKQLSYYTCKDVSFSASKSIRMPYEKPRSPGPFAYNIKDMSLEILPPHVLKEEYGSRTPSRGRPASKEGSTKISKSGRDFLGSIYYDGYNKPTPSSFYNSNEASRCVSTTIPVVTPSFASTVQNSYIEKRKNIVAINSDPVRKLHSRSRTRSNVSTFSDSEHTDETMEEIEFH